MLSATIFKHHNLNSSEITYKPYALKPQYKTISMLRPSHLIDHDLLGWLLCLLYIST